ncbi:MAG: YggS family pyridoxal phosphate-dependent enzyme [Bifidobacteriaceae bacterium]|jgi:pyridoxal phosphate enzyme (YggS family)|nr:YggS family pyridoxal phosphate-dependent enzyme [Bifidobacteriaceae bacterium]MCI1979211.1 YggS family pyridoxal phosphate-dependent enzyme [Bifidobacteriaceae bacterium]
MTDYLEHKNLANQQIAPEKAAKIADGVHRTLDRVAQAAQAAGRDASEVTLLAATKTRDVGEIMAALRAGIRVIGENRPQEVQIKAEALRRGASSEGIDFGFHLIGQLQTNKINKVLPLVDTIESVDSAAQAQKIATRALARGKHLNLFLEVNESGEESKSGCDPDRAYDEALAIAALDGVTLTGLMTIGAHVDDEAIIRKGFTHLRELRERLLADGGAALSSCRDLSMGMTQDMALAVDEGSTIVRVGTGIFGARAFI